MEARKRAEWNESMLKVRMKALDTAVMLRSYHSPLCLYLMLRRSRLLH